MPDASRWLSVVALAAIVALGAGMGQTSFGHAILRKAGLFEEPTSYTSLAFLHPQSLPEQLRSKRASIGVSFVIHNAGSTSSYYQWSVVLAEGRRPRHVAAGSVRLAAGREAAITRSVEVLCTRGTLRIIVDLAHPAESIDAWTACFSSRS